MTNNVPSSMKTAVIFFHESSGVSVLVNVYFLLNNEYFIKAAKYAKVVVFLLTMIAH